MTAGLQVRNDGGTFQIDGMFPQFVLNRKVVLTLNELNKDSDNNNKPYYTKSLSISDNEITAIASSSYAFPIYRNGTLATFASPVQNATVVVYVFAPVSQTAGNYGFQVFNDQGALVFDASQLPLRMVGFTTNEGDFTYQGGRVYAAITINNWLRVTSEFGWNGNFDTQRDIVYAGMTRQISNGVSVQNILLYDNFRVLENSFGVSIALEPNSVNRHIMVDVTDY